MRVHWWVAGGLVVLSGCGPASQASGFVGPTGGEVCLNERRVCIEVPSGGLADTVELKISPTGDVPPAVQGEGWEIGPSGTTFLKNASISFRYDALPDDGGFDPLILRLYTKEKGEWVPLEKPTVDRVRGVLRGEVSHLSPFVILRADRLPDGGLPIDIDGGQKDSGVIIIPPRPDGGRPDSGQPDSGQPDSGQPDAGKMDAGIDGGPKIDAGFDAGVDAGIPDAGPPDAGKPDAGFDAGVDAGVDAGIDAGFDAGIDAGFDAGFDAGVDAGVDAGTDAGIDAGVDAGQDAGEVDAGDGG